MDLIDNETMAMAKEYDDEHANDGRELEFYDDPSKQDNEAEDGAKNENAVDGEDSAKTDGDENTETEGNTDGTDETMTIADIVPDKEDDDNDEAPADELDIAPVFVNGVDMTQQLQRELETKTGEERYLYAHIAPAVLTGEDGNQIVVYSINNIPKDFKFGNQSDLTRARNDFMRIDQELQTRRAEYADRTANEQANAAQRADAAEDLSEIQDMQEEGLIPNFAKADSVDDMEDDPAAQLTDMILGFKDEMNDAYADRGLNRNVGFREAYNEFMRENPEIQDALDKDREEEAETPLKREDEERNDIARRTTSSRTISAAHTSNEPRRQEPKGLRTVQEWADWAQTVNPNEL